MVVLLTESNSVHIYYHWTVWSLYMFPQLRVYLEPRPTINDGIAMQTLTFSSLSSDNLFNKYRRIMAVHIRQEL